MAPLAEAERRRPARTSVRSALAALALGIVAASLLGEGLVHLAARWNPAVRYLSVRHTTRPLLFGSLAEYLASMPTHVVPHRNWFNYWNNALGLNDEEFVVPKPAGRFRIMALGDSFTYGLVPYPDSVMTVLKARLRSICRGKDLDVLNFGIGGTGVEDYRTILMLAFAEYAPDLVVVHFYAGNDGPDTYRIRDRAGWQWPDLSGYSRLWALTHNVLLVRHSVHSTVRAAADSPAGRAPDATVARGGAIVDPNYVFPADDPRLTGPTFEPETFDRILGDEMRGMYAALDPDTLDRAWQPIFEALEAMRERVTRGGSRFAVVVFPSVLQVDSDLPEQVLARLHDRRRYLRMTRDAIDPELPQQRLAVYCQRTGVPCFDLTPVLVRAQRAEPAARLYKLQETHWTVRGNRVAAEAEAERLARLVCPRVSGRGRGNPGGSVPSG